MAIRTLLSLSIAVTLAGCTTGVGPAGDAKVTTAETDIATEIRRRNFVPLAVPRTDFGPGTIVEVVENFDGTRRLERFSDMSTCGADAEELSVSPGGSVGLETGRQLRLDASVSFGAGAASVSPSAEYINGARIRIGRTATPSLDRIKIEKWRERIGEGYDGLNLPQICRDIVTDTPKSLYIVYEALAFENGAIVYDIKSGARVEATSEFSTIAEATAGVGFDGDSTITFEGPLYFGVKQLNYLNGQQVASRPAPPPAPAEAAPAATDGDAASADETLESVQVPQPGNATRSLTPAPAAPPAGPQELGNAELEALFGGAI